MGGKKKMKKRLQEICYAHQRRIEALEEFCYTTKHPEPPELDPNHEAKGRTMPIINMVRKAIERFSQQKCRK